MIDVIQDIEEMEMGEIEGKGNEKYIDKNQNQSGNVGNISIDDAGIHSENHSQLFSSIYSYDQQNFSQIQMMQIKDSQPAIFTYF